MSKIVENYLLQEVIGQGQYGKVFKATNMKTDEILAIKTIKIEKFRQVPKLHEFLSNEIQTLAKINNKNIIRFIEMLRTQNNVYLIYEYCNQGTLEEYIKRKKMLSEKEALDILTQILNGFKSLFRANILHRDLKPSNILIHNGDIKIADFGFCKTLLNERDMTQTMVGSPIYMAPEVMKGWTYNVKADIWSIGVVFFEMLFGYCPFEEQTICRLLTKIENKPLYIPTNLTKISEYSTKLLKAMLTVDPRKRITWEELLTIHEDYLKLNYKNNATTTQNGASSSQLVVQQQLNIYMNNQEQKQSSQAEQLSVKTQPCEIASINRVNNTSDQEKIEHNFCSDNFTSAEKRDGTADFIDNNFAPAMASDTTSRDGVNYLLFNNSNKKDYNNQCTQQQQDANTLEMHYSQNQTDFIQSKPIVFRKTVSVNVDQEISEKQKIQSQEQNIVAAQSQNYCTDSVSIKQEQCPTYQNSQISSQNEQIESRQEFNEKTIQMQNNTEPSSSFTKSFLEKEKKSCANQFIYPQSLNMKILIKERNKILYQIRVLNQAIEMSSDNIISLKISFFIIKIIVILYDKLLIFAKNEQNLHQDKENLEQSYELKVFIKILLNEIEQIKACELLFKEEIEKLLQKPENSSNNSLPVLSSFYYSLDYSPFKNEYEQYSINIEYFRKSVMEYIDFLQQKIKQDQDNYESSESIEQNEENYQKKKFIEYNCKKILIHSNEVIDCYLNHSNMKNTEVNFDGHKIFENLNECDNIQLYHILMSKIKLFPQQQVSALDKKSLEEKYNLNANLNQQLSIN